MSEYQSNVSNHERFLKNSKSEEDSLESVNFWMSNLDITTYDFPYIYHLLVKSFLDWQQLSSSQPMMEYSMWTILGFDGSWVTGDVTISDYLKNEAPQLLDECLKGQIKVIADWNSELSPYNEEHTICLFPLFTRGYQELYAIMVCVLPRQKVKSGGVEIASSISILFQNCFYKRFEYIFVEDMMSEQKKANDEAARTAILYQIVERMHDQIDVDMILTEVLDSIAFLYPTASLQLFMSQDHQSNNPRVKPLILQTWKDDVRVRTFMDGKLTIQEMKQGNGEDKLEIGFPLGGTQGVYGVFYLLADKDFLNEVDLQLVTTLVDTAGNAFEKSKLYEQSNLLIQELRLINELTQRVNQSLRLSEIYQFSNEELLNIFKADFCCILQFNKKLDGLEVVSSNVPALAKEVFEKDYGFGGLVYGKGEPVILSGYTVNMRIPSKFMEYSGSESLIAAPLTVKGEVMGAILLSHRKSHYFTYDNYRLLQTLSIHIALSVSNALLHAEVKRMANRDVLTDLYVRRYLDEVIHERQTHDFCGSLIVVDIDQFKQVNDMHGHQQGDKILKQVSEIVRTSIRKSDLAARWGGEELAIYLPQLGVKQAIVVAERIRRRVEEETSPSVTVSCGISEWNWMDDQVSVDSLFYLADMALYRAKNNGRNQIQIEDKNITKAPGL